MKICLTKEFPASPPKGYFLTKIFHPNVSSSGEICVNTLKQDWNSKLGIRNVLLVGYLLYIASIVLCFCHIFTFDISLTVSQGECVSLTVINREGIGGDGFLLQPSTPYLIPAPFYSASGRLYSLFLVLVVVTPACVHTS